MQTMRRKFLKGAGASGVLAVAGATGFLRIPGALAATWDAAAFDSKSMEGAMKLLGGTPADSKDIVITAPDLAENGAVVPVEVTVNIPGVDRIVLFAEKNVRPLIGDFRLKGGTQGYIAVRIKMGQTANIRAVASAGGKLYQAVKETKVTVGGCGG